MSTRKWMQSLCSEIEQDLQVVTTPEAREPLVRILDTLRAAEAAFLSNSDGPTIHDAVDLAAEVYPEYRGLDVRTYGMTLEILGFFRPEETVSVRHIQATHLGFTTPMLSFVKNKVALPAPVSSVLDPATFITPELRAYQGYKDITDVIRWYGGDNPCIRFKYRSAYGVGVLYLSPEAYAMLYAFAHATRSKPFPDEKEVTA